MSVPVLLVCATVAVSAAAAAIAIASTDATVEIRILAPPCLRRFVGSLRRVRARSATGVPNGSFTAVRFRTCERSSAARERRTTQTDLSSVFHPPHADFEWGRRGTLDALAVGGKLQGAEQDMRLGFRVKDDRQDHFLLFVAETDLEGERTEFLDRGNDRLVFPHVHGYRFRVLAGKHLETHEAGSRLRGRRRAHQSERDGDQPTGCFLRHKRLPPGASTLAPLAAQPCA